MKLEPEEATGPKEEKEFMHRKREEVSDKISCEPVSIAIGTANYQDFKYYKPLLGLFLLHLARCGEQKIK